MKYGYCEDCMHKGESCTRCYRSSHFESISNYVYEHRNDYEQ